MNANPPPKPSCRAVALRVIVKMLIILLAMFVFLSYANPEAAHYMITHPLDYLLITFPVHLFVFGLMFWLEMRDAVKGGDQ